MSQMRKNPKVPAILVATAIIALLGFGGWSIGMKRNSEPAGRKITFYQDSMHPWIKSDQPGKCTICGMDLTPIYEGDKGLGVGDNMVVLSPNSISVVNVKTEEVKRQPLRRTLLVAGTLEIDEARRAVLSAPAASRVEAVNVASTGVEVQKGESLLTLYSPDLVQKGRYYRSVIVAQGGTTSDKMPWAAGENPYSCACVSPVSGTVTERLVSAGQYVTDGEKLLTIVDRSVMWFRFDVYEQQLPWCELGQKIDVVVPAVPGKLFRSVVGFIEPTINDVTRTVKVRADIKNPAVTVKGISLRLLRLGMYAEGRVRSEIPDVVAAPRTAILSPGGSAYAYVDKGSGAYELRRVKLGRQGDEFWEVLQGLEEGDRVVTSGNVLIDAQAQFSQGNEPDTAMTDAVGMDDSASAQEAQDTTDTTQGAPLTDQKILAEPQPADGMTDPAGAQEDQDTTDTMHGASEAHCKVHTESPPAAGMTDPAGARAAQDTTDTTQAMPMGEHVPAPVAPNQAPSSGEEDKAPLIKCEDQEKAFRNFVNVAGYVSQSLAADDLKQFNWHMTRLPGVVLPLREWTVPPRWEGPMKRLFAFGVKPQPAVDLAAARKQFLAFSTVTVEFAKHLRTEEPAFNDLKIYHCPMAPKPGLWMQTQGPLRNPFYGAEMLTCGTEVKMTAAVGMDDPAGAQKDLVAMDTTHGAPQTDRKILPESQPAAGMADPAGARATPDTTVATQAMPMGEHVPAPVAPNQTPSSGEQGKARLTGCVDQQKAFRNFVDVAGYISQALAADDLKQFNAHMAQLPGVLIPLKEWTVPPRWEGPMKRLFAFEVKPQPAVDLAAARKQFLAFSTVTVELAKRLRTEEPAFADLKVYHCPMAPKPGLWMQTQGPLRNPFYGAEMLTCGTEVKP